MLHPLTATSSPCRPRSLFLLYLFLTTPKSPLLWLLFFPHFLSRVAYTEESSVWPFLLVGIHLLSTCPSIASSRKTRKQTDKNPILDQSNHLLSLFLYQGYGELEEIKHYNKSHSKYNFPNLKYNLQVAWRLYHGCRDMQGSWGRERSTNKERVPKWPPWGLRRKRWWSE